MTSRREQLIEDLARILVERVPSSELPAVLNAQMHDYFLKHPIKPGVVEQAMITALTRELK